MTGWQRLWLVFSLLFGVPAWFLGYEAYKTATFLVEMPVQPTSSKVERDKLFWQRAYAHHEAEPCRGALSISYSFSDSHYVTCDTPTRGRANALQWALLPGLIFGVIGYTIGWIIRGFRPKT